ncbi:MAG TPA: hypothetical protein VMW48_19350 [Vicinamibacterales bacterium]|nr:hypothetical protein [Vicinamibacterales bacterium]
MGRLVGAGVALVLGVALPGASAPPSQPSEPRYEQNIPLDHPAIRYPGDAPEDAVSRVAARLARGDLRLDSRAGASVLPSLLRALDIHADSQLLVFSKTSVQHASIAPRRPRAVYFGDEVAVAVVPHTGTIELAAMDPRQGAMFYVLNGVTRPAPSITRRDTCLQCHHGVATMGVPGFFVSSVYPSAGGTPEREGAIIADHRTPFAERWGGWYVTGTHGAVPHRGNAVAANPAEPTVLDVGGARNLTSLAGRFDLGDYLEPTSDLVALMTFEHQTQGLNYLLRLGWEARAAAHGGPSLPPPQTPLDARVDEVVRYLLFVDEAPFSASLRGVSSFTRTFSDRGPRDGRGRSLRDFDLDRRLFRYPLSYLVYTATFDALPDDARARVYQRLYDVLTGQDRGPEFAALAAADRTAVLEILRETKAGLPAYWRVGR